ncbi:hypothetical protein SZN_35047 [Streptomyces zinciresistens K42]|uniref:Uncharacterized protein n=1 Tax=Streptomyces zinciresistens K42 TaxID=700597 RepID=G2GNA4_9ACTN|nr:hypothetical protein [Streptomyces zinciresistens]EGX55015.1 hypothetical protein SZN_35047 [Streptomyces zinciresistens K42]
MAGSSRRVPHPARAAAGAVIAALAAVLTVFLGQLPCGDVPFGGPASVSSAVHTGTAVHADDGRGDSAEPVRGPRETPGERHTPPASGCRPETGGTAARPRTPVPAAVPPASAPSAQRHQGRAPPFVRGM